MDTNTTYGLSYWESPGMVVTPVSPRDWLTTGDGEISDHTTYKQSYLGNWCIKPESSITPCEKQWLGRGPIQTVTTQKHDYTWKCVDPAEAYKAQHNLYCEPAPLSDDTTYRLSYYPSGCNIPVASYAAIRKYTKSSVPMDDNTTYKLSYWLNEATAKEDHPWSKKREYLPPTEPMDGCTTYKLSYWPHSEKRRSAIVLPETDNFLNAGCCFDDNTTYRLSYFECGADKRDPIRQPENIHFSSCPLPYDTTHRMSFLGNWCMKQEAPITPCDKQWLGRGPVQSVTTQKHDYTWKQGMLQDDLRREDNLVCSPLPLECCTTHRLSYQPNDCKCLTPTQKYVPIRVYNPPNVSMKSETTMQLSYQPVEPTGPVEKPWSDKPPYHPPVTPMEDNSTYNLSYIPPGTLVL